MAAQVAVIACADYDQARIDAAMDEAVGRFGGLERFIKPGWRVLLKPNFLKPAAAEKAITTHPSIIQRAIELVRACGAEPFIGDSPAWGSLRNVMRQSGSAAVAERYGVDVVEFKKQVRVANTQGQVYEHLHIDRAARDADAIINLGKLKTHQQLLLTGAVKNLFGCVAGKRKAWWHFKAGAFDNYFARMLMENARLLRPVFTVVDAVIGMEGDGPSDGAPRRLGFLLAGVDCVAIDRVACEILGIAADEYRIMQAARELGVASVELDNIDVVGCSIDDLRVADFKLPKLSPIGFSLPRVVKSALKQQWIVRMEEPHAHAR